MLRKLILFCCDTNSTRFVFPHPPLLRNKKDSWLSVVISPFRKISSHNSEEDKAVFYASDDEDRNSFPDVEANQKSSSSSDLFNFKPESNQSREISRSLNFLNSEDADENSSDFKHNFEQRQAKTLPISSVSSPSPPSATATKFLRTMSIGAAFGSKGIGIGNKMGSEVPAQSER